jgi:hypothetical protein
VQWDASANSVARQGSVFWIVRPEIKLGSVIAFILVILGVVALRYSGIAFTTPGEAEDFLGLRILQHLHHHFIPQFLEAVALVGGGIILLFMKPKQG